MNDPRAGIGSIIVDVGVLDISSIRWAAQAIHEFKERFGHPAGCASSNAVYACEFLRESGSPALEARAAAIFTLPQTVGASYVFHGPVRNAPRACAACATMDAMLGTKDATWATGCSARRIHCTRLCMLKRCRADGFGGTNAGD